LCWPLPATANQVTGSRYLGYAHGAAGIADALLDYVAIAGDAQALRVVQGAARWVVALARPALADGSGLAWQAEAGAAAAAALWCHGAAGIGRFLFHCAQRKRKRPIPA